MSDTQAALKRLGAVAYVAGRVQQEHGDAKAAAKAALKAVGLNNGSLTAALDDGTEIADVTLKKGAVSPRVVDEAALVEWLEANHPTEVETVTVTRPRAAFVSVLLERAKKDGIAVTADGEVIPGIDVTVGDPAIVVVPRQEAGPAIIAALATRELPAIAAALGGDA